MTAVELTRKLTKRNVLPSGREPGGSERPCSEQDCKNTEMIIDSPKPHERFSTSLLVSLNDAKPLKIVHPGNDHCRIFTMLTAVAA